MKKIKSTKPHKIETWNLRTSEPPTQLWVYVNINDLITNNLFQMATKFLIPDQMEFIRRKSFRKTLQVVGEFPEKTTHSQSNEAKRNLFFLLPVNALSQLAIWFVGILLLQWVKNFFSCCEVFIPMFLIFLRLFYSLSMFLNGTFDFNDKLAF